MPLIDMPLEQLRKYGGTNPRPEDFDDYWKEAIEELDGTEAKPVLKRASFESVAADCYDLTFTGVRGAKIYAKVLVPRGAKKKVPAVLQFHGYSGSSGNWSSKLNFAAEGILVAAMDCRGQGGRSEDTGGYKGTTFHGNIVRGLDDEPRNMMFRHIFLDTAQLARVVMDMDMVDAANVGAMGGSQGGALTLACASLEPRIVRAASQYPFLLDYRRVWDMDLAKNAYDEITTWFRNFDPTHEREQEVFTRLGYIDIQHLVQRIRGEVFMCTALADTICPPSTQFAAYNKIAAGKRMAIYPDFGHEWIPDWEDRAFSFMCAGVPRESLSD